MATDCVHGAATLWDCEECWNNNLYAKAIRKGDKRRAADLAVFMGLRS